jgi:acyl carrier protein
MHSYTRTLRQFIAENFLFSEPGAADSFEDDTSLVDTGIVDSTGILELVAFLEREYGISVGDEELAPGNLDSIRRLTAFLERKLAHATCTTAA